MTGEEFGLTCEITAAGEALVMLYGELDIASSDRVFGYVRDVIDRYRLPVILDVAGLTFCDARGLGTLVRISNHAIQAGSSVQLASPGPHLLRIIRITGLDRSLAIRIPPGRYGPSPGWAIPHVHLGDAPAEGMSPATTAGRMGPIISAHEHRSMP